MATDAAFLRAFMFFADAKVAGDIPLLPRAAEATSRSPAPLRTLQRRRLVALTCAGLCAPAGPDSSTCLWPLLARLLDSPDRLPRVCTALLPGCLEWAACTALHAGTDAPGTESLDAGVHGVLSLVCALDPAEPWLGFPRTRSLLPALAAFAAPGLGAGLEGAGADAAMEGVDAALSLLGNLTEGAAGRAGAPLGAADAGALAHVICRLVARVAAAGGQLPGRGDTGTLPGSRLAPEVERQLAGLASHAFLQALVGPLLSLEAQCGGMPGALALCRLLDALAGAVPGMRERLMLKLSVGTPFLAQLWSGYLQPGMQAHGLTGQPWRARGLGPRHPGEDPGWMLPLSILSSTCSILISTGEDGDLYDRTFPLPLPDLVQALKRAVWWVLGGGEAARAQAQGGPGPGLQAQVVETAGRLLGQLCDRNGRRAFVAAEAFHVPASFPVDDRASYYEAEESWQLRTGSYSRDFVPVRRGQVLNDAFQALGGAGGTLKGRVRIQFISDLGFPEAGVDGGGLFKEFLEEVSKEGFDPGRGLFAVTSDQRLYPAPGAAALVPDAPRLLAFLGQLLGKALLEGTLVDLPLATFFLQKMAGRGCELRDLASLDPELAANLGKLRAYDAATLAGLELTFTVTDVLAGEAREVELVQGGARRSVTRDNVIEYVHRMADFKLNRQLAGPVGAFLGGLHSIIPPHWLAPFSAAELQALISGGEQGLDLADLAAHARYGGGYAADHPSILLLWRALTALTAADQALFLRFMAGAATGEALGRLPTASTCMNLLKLPPYTSLEVMLDKLRYAITAGAGFDLS
ncbi:E3 ubiquitin-protein ligase UPL6 [Auxenochlorella protothecoides]|uniref:HECT-type E3 ubiquitin transferase n=1 Tax=Auxenochlorella protothecoides TaxID=3075 RepID=A0A087ST46_AUXPR|nr:E3 ubiquitin-protein ligase UPL6 [Auxenochlorella protothecoides]KFM28900.1 E3 ubiquitin-protein ligase UPL6 [Auxenochlorella protothecoides]